MLTIADILKETGLSSSTLRLYACRPEVDKLFKKHRFFSKWTLPKESLFKIIDLIPKARNHVKKVMEI